MSSHLEAPFLALRWTYGLVPLLAGLDKFTNVLADWAGYLSPAVAGWIPLAPETFMHVVGIAEVAVGLLVLTRWTRYGAYLACAWLLAIAGNLIVLGALDVAVRDLAMAVGAFTLARFAEEEEAFRGARRPGKEAHSVA